MAEPLFEADRISAYVDGEMAPQDAAAMGAEIARDPVLARKVAQYQALRVGVAGIGSEAVIITLPAPVAARHLPLGLCAALAAGIVALVVSGIWVGKAYQRASGAVLQQTLMAQTADAAAMIANFDTVFGAARLPPSDLPPSDLGLAEQGDLVAPLMLANGLQPTAVARVALPSGEVASARGFAGVKGCHLGLYTQAGGAGRPQAMQITDDGQTLLAQWADASARFTLVSRSMNPTRFATLALALRRATAAPDQDHPDLLLALTEARQPCLG